MIPSLIACTCVFAIAFIVFLILWLSRRKQLRRLQTQLEEETNRRKKANESMLQAQKNLKTETELRKNLEGLLKQSTNRVAELQATVSSHSQANTKLNNENKELKNQNKGLADDLYDVKLIASKMKKYIYQCRNKIDFLSDQELQRNKSTRAVSFWTKNLGKIQFDYADLTNYVTDKMQVFGGEVPADEKYKRLQKAFDDHMVIEKCDMPVTAKIKGASGETYETTLHSCTCEDFVKGHYKTPCKHMYRLAIESGMLSIYDKTFCKTLEQDLQYLREQKTALAQREKNLKARETRLNKKQAEQKAKGSGKKL